MKGEREKMERGRKGRYIGREGRVNKGLLIYMMINNKWLITILLRVCNVVSMNDRGFSVIDRHLA